MFEKREIINALDIAKDKHLDNNILGLFSKSAILKIINKIRWKKYGASKHEGTLMTEIQFEKAIHSRKFFSTINKIGLKG